MQSLIVTVLLALAVPPEAPRQVSPKALLSAYLKNEVAADLEFKGKPIRLFGIVGQIGKDGLQHIFVTLETGDQIRKVRCYFHDNQAPAVAQLSRGQLVAIDGSVSSFVMENPMVAATSVEWAAPSEQAELPLLAARSAEVCLPEMLHAAVREKLSAEAAKASKMLTDGDLQAAYSKFDQEVGKERPEFLKIPSAARAELAAKKLTPLACDHPLVSALMPCEEDGTVGPECRSAMVRKAIAKLKR